LRCEPPGLGVVLAGGSGPEDQGDGAIAGGGLDHDLALDGEVLLP